jgi:hypothetical protein
LGIFFLVLVFCTNKNLATLNLAAPVQDEGISVTVYHRGQSRHPVVLESRVQHGAAGGRLGPVELLLVPQENVEKLGVSTGFQAWYKNSSFCQLPGSEYKTSCYGQRPILNFATRAKL